MSVLITYALHEPESEPGDLTLSGDLYEGNYAEWLPRLSRSLRLRNLYNFMTEDF